MSEPLRVLNSGQPPPGKGGGGAKTHVEASTMSRCDKQGDINSGA